MQNYLIKIIIYHRRQVTVAIWKIMFYQQQYFSFIFTIFLMFVWYCLTVEDFIKKFHQTEYEEKALNFSSMIT